jgi:drug/metabolite transporter (DMT)-like permease
VFIIVNQGKTDGTVTTTGFVLLLGAVLSAVGYNVLSRKISCDYTPFERTYAMATIGFVVFMSTALINDSTSIYRMAIAFTNPNFTFGVLYLGIVSSVIAFLLLNYANTHLPVAKTTAFSNLTTVVAVIAGALFLKERFTLISALSTVMIIAGVTVVQMLGVKNKK